MSNNQQAVRAKLERTVPCFGQPEACRNLDRFRRNHLSLTVMSVPGTLLLFVFAYLPMMGIIMAFKDYRFETGILA